MAQTVRICLQCRRPRFNPQVKNIPWRRKWQPTPVFLPGEFHGQRSLVVYSAWGCKELDTTEWLTLSLSQPSGSNARWQWIHSMWHHIHNFKTRTAVLHIALGEYIYNTSVKICTYSNIRRSVTFQESEAETGWQRNIWVLSSVCNISFLKTEKATETNLANSYHVF